MSIKLVRIAFGNCIRLVKNEFNLNMAGYYRVNYDTNNWNLIIEQLRNETDKISALNRAQLLDDAFNIARAGILDYSIAFQLSRYLVHEKEFAPWKSALNAFRYIDRMLYATPQRQLFRVTYHLRCIGTGCRHFYFFFAKIVHVLNF